MNVSWDTESQAQKFVEEYHLPFVPGHDSNTVIASAYGVDSTPSNFFIDKNWVLVERKIGTFEGDLESEFTRRIEKLLAP